MKLELEILMHDKSKLEKSRAKNLNLIKNEKNKKKKKK